MPSVSVIANRTRGEGHFMDWKLELVIIPVSDIDRAKAFYTDKAGFNADHDHTVSDEIRFVQLTPPGSACSIAIGKGITDAPPGSVVGLQMVVPDIEAAHDELVKRGAEVSEIQELAWGRFVFFADPDGNKWAVQQLLRLNSVGLVGVSRPVGRVLCARLRGPTVIHLGLPLPTASCGLPASIGRAALERSRRPTA